MKTPELWGVPTFDWLIAKSELRKRFWAFSVRTPEGFKGVADVIFQGGQIEVVEQTTSRRLTVPRD